MVRIRATCPQCDHDVELTSDDVTAFVCADTNEGSYAFRCPDCDVAVSVEADARIIELLVDRGVDKRVWHLPAELAETKHGERLQYDDLLDLHFLLQRDTWFAELEAMTLASMVPQSELGAFLATDAGADADAVARRFGTTTWIAERALELRRSTQPMGHGAESV